MYANTLKSIATESVAEKIKVTEGLMEMAAKDGKLSIVISNMTEAECQYFYDKGFAVKSIPSVQGFSTKITWGFTEINDR